MVHSQGDGEAVDVSKKNEDIGGQPAGSAWHAFTMVTWALVVFSTPGNTQLFTQCSLITVQFLDRLLE